MTERVIINEVGPRDGLQSQRANISLDDKVELIEALVKAGVRSVEAGSFVSPKAVPQMANTDTLWPRLPARDTVQYSGLVPNLRGLDRALAVDVQEIAVVLSATEQMNRRNINMSLAETVAACEETILAAKKRQVRAKAYVAVAFECPFEGLVPVERVLDLCDRMVVAGADEIVIADTIGAACPRQVATVLREVVVRHDASLVSVHFHDTRAFALANTWAALEAGIRKFDASVGGLGGCPFAPGATGNVATEDLVLMVEQCGFNTGIDVDELYHAVELAERMTGQTLGGRTRRWIESAKSKKARS